MARWQELNETIKDAIARKEFFDAELRLAALWREVRSDTDRCCTHFTEGLLRDAQGRFDEAEAAFQAALALDTRLRGPMHAAVADTLHSLGIVRSHRADHDGALAAFSESARIFLQVRPFQAATVLSSAGHELLSLGRLDEASQRFDAALDLVQREPLVPVHDAVRVWSGAGEVMRRLGRFPAALGRFAMATRFARPKMWSKLADRVARAWLMVGIVSRDNLSDGRAQAALAFWFASAVGTGEIHTRAKSELAALPERGLAIGDPDAFRVTYKDSADNVHVASAVRGLYFVKTELCVSVGERVEDVLIENGRVARCRFSLRTTPPSASVPRQN